MYAIVLRFPPASGEAEVVGEEGVASAGIVDFISGPLLLFPPFFFVDFAELLSVVAISITILV